jgi:hypothetical protein
MRLSPAALLIALSLTAQAQTTPAPNPTLEQALLQSRTSLLLNDGKFSGPGAAVLDTAIQQSRFVLLGEDHITREIPPIAAAVCDIMHPDAYAVEAGPYATRFVASLLAASNLTPPDPAHPGTQLTLFDLRQLRYRNLGLSPQWERIIYSNHLLILIPELSVASIIQ